LGFFAKHPGPSSVFLTECWGRSFGVHPTWALFFLFPHGFFDLKVILTVLAYSLVLFFIFSAEDGRVAKVGC